MGPIGFGETSVRNTNTRCVIAQKSAVLIYFAVEAWNYYFLFLKWVTCSAEQSIILYC